MLTNLIIRRFKGFDDAEIELGDRVVFIGPNNSGKTSALQALALWDLGLRKWNEKRGSGEVPKKRPGVTINRRDLIAVPVPNSNLLWKNLRVRESVGPRSTQNIRIEIVVKGVSEGAEWECGFEFDYANDESFYCRPLKIGNGINSDRMPVPPQALSSRIAYLPPMSGLAAAETRLDEGAINVRLGEGRTAEVLRNLCFQVFDSENGRERWQKLTKKIQNLFGIWLKEPQYIAERGEINLAYEEKGGIKIDLDISCSGRGLQQTLLILAHMTVNAKSILLMDEPDAHLEILRQRQIYQLLTDTASQNGNQIIAASHSEIILNEAADRDLVIAFVGKPHRIADRGSQVLKSLREIGFEHYYQAEETGWVIYLEGSTDLAILRVLAGLLNHNAQNWLERPFVHYVGNQPKKAQEHFYGLREAKADLRGIAIFDRLDRGLAGDNNLIQHQWKRREIESYFVSRGTILSWTRDFAGKYADGPLFGESWSDKMNEEIKKLEDALKVLGKPSPWSYDSKITDDFLDPLFQNFFCEIGLPNLMRKTEYHTLAKYVNPRELDPEISEVLEKIISVASG